MAGRKSKTATAGKPKATRKASTKSSARVGAKLSVVKSKPSKATGSKKTGPQTASPKAIAKGKKKAVDSSVSAVQNARLKTKTSAAAKSRTKSAIKSGVKSGGRKPAGLKTAEMTDVFSELERLAAYIDAARREIAAISPQDVKDEFLPSATDELDAIIEATATATNTIMDSCELVEGVMGDVSDAVGAKLMDATTLIYEACTFQDITGQRIGKVITALKNIEDRIDALVLALGDELIAPKVKNKSTEPKPEAKKTLTDADLLEGPQLGAKAKSQAEIDDLLASFD